MSIDSIASDLSSVISFMFGTLFKLTIALCHPCIVFLCICVWVCVYWCHHQVKKSQIKETVQNNCSSLVNILNFITSLAFRRSSFALTDTLLWVHSVILDIQQISRVEQRLWISSYSLKVRFMMEICDFTFLFSTQPQHCIVSVQVLIFLFHESSSIYNQFLKWAVSISTSGN